MSLSACENIITNNDQNIADNIQAIQKNEAVNDAVDIEVPEVFSAVPQDKLGLIPEIKDYTLIDIRTPEEIETGKILKKALEIDFYAENFKDEIAKLEKDGKYLIYCAHGNRTKEAKDIMKEAGFTTVYDLEGGIAAWDAPLYIKYDRNEVLADYIGKPSVIILASTSCPHCRNAMPAFETDIWDVYKDKANIFVNVGNGGVFPEERIAQGTKPKLSFDLLTDEECGYVPSFVVLDKDGEVALKSCGAEKNVEDIKAKLDELL
jgi:rhodanese-related sulfurtransferase